MSSQALHVIFCLGWMDASTELYQQETQHIFGGDRLASLNPQTETTVHVVGFPLPLIYLEENIAGVGVRGGHPSVGWYYFVLFHINSGNIPCLSLHYTEYTLLLQLPLVECIGFRCVSSGVHR